MTRRFELYRTWQTWLNEVPVLGESSYGLIARAIILTGGQLDEVEFVTGASTADIFKVYQWIDEKKLLDSLVSYEKTTKIRKDDKKNAIEEMTMSTSANKRRARTFTRAEMVDYAKRKLLQANEEIQFLGLKHNILSCEYQGKSFKVYISSSRDYEFMRRSLELNTYRVSAWNKGNEKIFTSCDYYALLVKADKNTKYVTDTEEGIEGLFVSQGELNQWFTQKISLQSGMINCYVHFSQLPGEGRSSIKVIDDREESSLPLNHLFQLGWTIR